MRNPKADIDLAFGAFIDSSYYPQISQISSYFQVATGLRVGLLVNRAGPQEDFRIEWPEGRLGGRGRAYTRTLKGKHAMTDKRRGEPLRPHHLDLSQGMPFSGHDGAGDRHDEHTHLLREILAAQDRQNELLEELAGQLGAAQRQRATELGQWKQANPQLARYCRMAAEALGRVQTEFLTSLTQEVNENYEALLDGEFMLNEFVDRFGPRLAHLNGLLQVLSQLSSTPSPANTPNSP